MKTYQSVCNTLYSKYIRKQISVMNISNLFIAAQLFKYCELHCILPQILSYIWAFDASSVQKTDLTQAKLPDIKVLSFLKAAAFCFRP